MATATTISLSPTEIKPEYYRPGNTLEASRQASQYLQKNHDDFHIFFHPDGLHNHIAHHLLALWALNASSSALEKAWEKNKDTQRAQPEIDEEVLRKLVKGEEEGNGEAFLKYVGPRERYHTWLEFFRKQIEARGEEEVVKRFLFAGDEVAETMLVRMFGGFLHPIIHLGYGVEFAQPAIVAEALAQAACHEAWIGDFLLPAEKAAANNRAAKRPSKTIVELLDEIHADAKLSQAADWDDGNKIRDGILVRAAEEMVAYAGQFYLSEEGGEEELERRCAEMTNAVSYYSAGAQHPPNMVMWDFYFIHCVNSTIFLSSFLHQTFLTLAQKRRLLEFKVRMDLAMYASRSSPAIDLSEIHTYAPLHPSAADNNWDAIIARVNEFPDDGHAAKLVRALAHGQKICEPYEGREEFRVKGADWLRMGHMAIDSVEMTKRFGMNGTWVRSAGFEEAWADVPLRSQL